MRQLGGQKKNTVSKQNMFEFDKDFSSLLRPQPTQCLKFKIKVKKIKQQNWSFVSCL